MPTSDEKLTHQLILEKLFNKNQLIPRLREEFDNEIFKSLLKQANIPTALGIDMLVQMALHKRCDLPTLLGTLRFHTDTAQEIAYYIESALYNELMYWDEVTQTLILRFGINNELQLELDKFQFPLPMIAPPKLVEKNSECGFYLTKRSLILKNNHHNEDICLDHINRINATKLTINKDTATLIKNRWRNLDKQKPSETRLDFTKRKKAFEKYNRVSREVIDLVLLEDNLFYLLHAYDKRGRTYCIGYHISYQGTAWNKAIVEFADKEFIE